MDCDEQMVGVVKTILSGVVQRATVAAAAAARSKVILQKEKQRQQTQAISNRQGRNVTVLKTFDAFHLSADVHVMPASVQGGG